MGRANNKANATAGASMRRGANDRSSVHGKGEMTGLPRPWAPYNPGWDEEDMKDPSTLMSAWGTSPPAQLPVSWMTGEPLAAEGEWTGFADSSTEIAREQKYEVCGMCGEKLGRKKVYGVVNEAKGTVSGTGMHATCALIVFQYCPHFLHKGADKSFRLWTGKGHGLQFTQKELDLEIELNDPKLHPDAAPITLDGIKELARAEKKAGKKKPVLRRGRRSN